MRPISLVMVPLMCLAAYVTSMAVDDTNRPALGFDLTKLRKFYDAKGQDPDAAMQELVAYLREELSHPSSPRMGVGGGPIDSVYVQEVMITVMAQTVSRESLLKALNRERDDSIKDRIMVALVAAGDRTFLSSVQSLLQTRNDNLARLAAVRALRNVPRKDIESVLPAMRDDTYSRIVLRDGTYRKVYPIRQAAYEALAQSGVPAEGWELEAPLTAETQAEALSAVLADENAEQAATVLRALENSSPKDAERLAKSFVEANAAKPHLVSAVKEAERILRRSEERNGKPRQNTRTD